MINDVLLSRLLAGVGLFLSACGFSSAQNLVANAQFEDPNTCVEFNATCAPEAWREVNYGRTFYINREKGGKAGFMLSNNPNMRTFLFTELLCPLEPGQSYKVTFDLNLRGAPFFPFGFWLSKENLSEHFRPDTVAATVDFSEGASLKKLKKMVWVPFSGRFEARGGEQFLYIGMMGPATPDKYDWTSVFYIDNITLEPVRGNGELCATAPEKLKALYAYDRRHVGEPQEEIEQKQDSIPVAAEVEEEEEEAPAVLAAPQPDTLLLSGVCFDFNKSTLNAHYAAVTDSLADKIMARHPQKILINGHTDNIGTDEFNRTLSLARAHTAAGILVTKGFPADNIVCDGKGESLPVATNDTESGRAANRRIEFILW